jgi:O-antigen/teichoic acid export membrane protein
MENDRNKILRTNILYSSALKIVSLLTSLLIVPTTISYLNSEVYGIWMTITSVLFWIGTFDIGLGNGMRNYLTEAISKQDYELGRKYISTTFLLLTAIALLLGAVTAVPMWLINFNDFFNTHAISNDELRSAVVVAVGFTLCNFVLKNIGFIYVAMQKYAVNDFLTVSGNVISLGVIFLLTKFTQGNLLYVVLVYTATSCIVFSLAAIPLFIKHPQLKPSLKSFDKALSKQVVGKGLGFFIIQITSCLVIFGAANVFITQYCGPVDVTVYNVSYKYFNLLVIAYTIVLSPMWNAYTDAYVKGDMHWIEQTFNRALKMWALSLLGGTLMLVGSQLFYHLWVGEKVTIPFSVSLCTLVYVCFFNLNNCVTYLINGLNKIRVQIITSLVFTAVYLLTVKSLGKEMGIEGIVYSMAFCYAAMAMIHLYQCRLLIKQKARGIWNK